MSTDPLLQSLAGLTATVASIRRGQLDAERERTGACGHTTEATPGISIPATATCLRAKGHRGKHEDEYARAWTTRGPVMYREG
ncbi:hypothetical protein [Nocardiopsis synnemataformans]|uniref:hypothetical protein n=1 Tax=Nocardiopsis synnemataformans TaxID=61305 RepID=UPI003EBD9C06